MSGLRVLIPINILKNLKRPVLILARDLKKRKMAAHFSLPFRVGITQDQSGNMVNGIAKAKQEAGERFGNYWFAVFEMRKSKPVLKVQSLSL